VLKQDSINTKTPWEGNGNHQTRCIWDCNENHVSVREGHQIHRWFGAHERGTRCYANPPKGRKKGYWRTQNGVVDYKGIKVGLLSAKIPKKCHNMLHHKRKTKQKIIGLWWIRKGKDIYMAAVN
jgi:hypothetical protein